MGQLQVRDGDTTSIFTVAADPTDVVMDRVASTMRAVEDTPDTYSFIVTDLVGTESPCSVRGILAVHSGHPHCLKVNSNRDLICSDLTTKWRSGRLGRPVDLWACQAISFKASGVREGGAIPPLPRNCER